MPWLKVSDTAMQNSIVRRALDLPHANAEYVYTLFGVMLGCAVEAAALKADYVIERNSIAAKVGLDRCDQIIQDAITCGYITHEVQLKNGIRAYKLVEDEDLFHMRLKSEIDWENRRRNDTRSKSLIVPIRVRDGDACRWCGRVVYWGDQKSARGGTYDHLHPTQPAEKASDMVVACRSCNSARKDNTEWGGKLLPPPSKPYYGRKTVEFLAENDVIVALSPESEKPTVPAAQFLQSGLAAGEPEGSKNPQGKDGVVCAITEEASSVRSRQTENSLVLSAPLNGESAVNRTQREPAESGNATTDSETQIISEWLADLEQQKRDAGEAINHEAPPRAQDEGDAPHPEQSDRDSWHPAYRIPDETVPDATPQGKDGVVCAITEEASSVRSRQTENSTTVDVPESVSSGARCKRRRKRRRIRQKDTAEPVSPIGMSQHSELLRIPPNPQGDGYGCAGSGRDGTATKIQGDISLPPVAAPENPPNSSELLRIPPNPQGDGYGCAGSGRDGTATKNITSSSRKRRRGKRKGKVSNACSTV